MFVKVFTQFSALWLKHRTNGVSVVTDYFTEAASPSLINTDQMSLTGHSLKKLSFSCSKLATLGRA